MNSIIKYSRRQISSMFPGEAPQQLLSHSVSHSKAFFNKVWISVWGGDGGMGNSSLGAHLSFRVSGCSFYLLLQSSLVFSLLLISQSLITPF